MKFKLKYFLPVEREATNLLDILSEPYETLSYGEQERRYITMSWLDRAKIMLGQFQQAIVEPIWGDLRHQQIKQIAADKTEFRISPKEQKINQNITIASVSLGLSTGGALFYPPLYLLALPGIVYTSLPYFQDAYQTIWKERRIGIATLDSIIITMCVATGYFVPAALSNFFFYFSRKLLVRTEDHSKRNLANVLGELPGTVWIVDEQGEREIALDNIKIEDTVVVYAGGVIPVDGIVTEGVASVDQHMLTGEAQPSEKETGDNVFAFTIVLAGHIAIKVQKTGEATVAAHIMQVLQQTINYKTSFQSRGERIADRSALSMLTLGAVSLPFLGVSGASGVVNSNFGINMRVISPFGMLTFLNLAAMDGILIKDGRTLELLNRVDTVVFDKTGTLTLYQLQLCHIYNYSELTEDELLAYAAAAEFRQTHPIALAIGQAAKTRQLTLPSIHAAQYEVGYGLQVHLDDRLIHVGSERFMRMKGINLPQAVDELQASSYAQGHSLVWVAIDGIGAGAIELQAAVRPETKKVINALQQRKLAVYIMSGDYEEPTRKLAQSLNIEHYFANTLPEDKAQLVKQLQQEGRSVCFVGDGINDAIALRQADVSVSLRGATTLAMDTAQIVLLDENLTKFIRMFELTREFDANMRRSFLLTIIPGILNLGGAFFLGSGLILSVILDRTGQLGGVLNAVLPLWQRHKAEKLQPTGLPSDEQK